MNINWKQLSKSEKTAYICGISAGLILLIAEISLNFVDFLLSYSWWTAWIIKGLVLILMIKIFIEIGKIGFNAGRRHNQRMMEKQRRNL